MNVIIAITFNLVNEYCIVDFSKHQCTEYMYLKKNFKSINTASLTFCWVSKLSYCIHQPLYMTCKTIVIFPHILRLLLIFALTLPQYNTVSCQTNRTV